MDCRRYANTRNITVRGPQKIWNTKYEYITKLIPAEKSYATISLGSKKDIDLALESAKNGFEINISSSSPKNILVFHYNHIVKND